MLTDLLRVTLRVADALESCGARYLVGGSLASSLSGEPRSTLDVDLLVALTESQVDRFLDALGDEFYADREALRLAVRTRSSANVIHQTTSLKFDLFVLGGTPLDEEQMNRGLRILVATEPDRYLRVYRPEDILLQKLLWFRRGDEVSERQWRDVLGIIGVQSSRLDEAYLRRGAAVLGVSDLLEKALWEGRA